ncbi:hypothetical protein TanjilG_02043 [Lupinus angustifolius]|nr:hypothetical protein TanjilG_02043 [Lupinus angustifolius]
MAFSISASSTLVSSTLFVPTSSSSTKLSSFSSLQFPLHTQLLHFPTFSSSRPRILPLVVEAKKQSFSTFGELLDNADKPVLVDFYATWCGPCQFMIPILNEVSTRLNDKIQVVKIDTEKYPSIANKYDIQALPTFIIFKDGEPYDRFMITFSVDDLDVEVILDS